MESGFKGRAFKDMGGQGQWWSHTAVHGSMHCRHCYTVLHGRMDVHDWPV